MFLFRLEETNLIQTTKRELYPNSTNPEILPIPKDIYPIDVPDGQRLISASWNTETKSVDAVFDTISIPPDPHGFLKACFDGTNLALFEIFTLVFGATFASVTAARWYDQMIAGSNPGLFLIATPSYAGGFGLALNQLVATVGLSEEQKVTIRSALVQFGLPGDMV